MAAMDSDEIPPNLYPDEQGQNIQNDDITERVPNGNETNKPKAKNTQKKPEKDQTKAKEQYAGNSSIIQRPRLVRRSNRTARLRNETRPKTENSKPRPKSETRVSVTNLLTTPRKESYESPPNLSNKTDTKRKVSFKLNEKSQKGFKGPACTPCGNKSTFRAAGNWCRNCNEALCEICTDHHKSLRILQTHELIRISPNDEAPFRLKINEICMFHKDEKFEFFCYEHDIPICSHCVTSTHKFCKDVFTIDEAAEKFSVSTEMQSVSDKVKGLSDIVQKLQTRRTKNMEELNLQRQTIEEKISKFRDDMVKHFDAMKQKSLEMLADVYDKTLQEIKYQDEALQERQQSVADMQKDIKMMEKYASQYQVFLGTKNLKEKEVNEIQLLKGFQEQFHAASLEFVSSTFMGLPLKEETFGQVKSNIRPMKLPLNNYRDKKESRKAPRKLTVNALPQNIILKSKSSFSIENEGNYNFICGGTILPDGRCILMDNNSKTLLVLSPKGGQLHKIEFKASPWEAAPLDRDKIVLTFLDKKEIVMLETQKFEIVDTIKVSNFCTGITSCGGKIIVVCEKIGILILEKAGTIVDTHQIDVSGIKYITAASGCIYYTENIQNTVNCIDMNGSPVFIFQNDILKYPCAITIVNDKFVLATGYNSKNVIAVALDGKSHKIIQTHKDGLLYPTAIDFCNETNTLMLCKKKGGAVEVFEMTLFESSINEHKC